MTMSTSVSLFVTLNEKKRKAGPCLNPQDHQSWRKLKCKLEKLIFGHEQTPESDLRESLRIPAQLNVQFERRGVYASGTIAEIGDGGCFVRTSVPMHRGSMLNLTIVGPSLSSCRVQGEVVWTSSTSPIQRGMGIRFHFASEQQRLGLYRLVDFCLFRTKSVALAV